MAINPAKYPPWLKFGIQTARGAGNGEEQTFNSFLGVSEPVKTLLFTKKSGGESLEKTYVAKKFRTDSDFFFPGQAF
ncbi:hypothetical protein CYJ84_10245 [Lactobacillus delbrueckii]|nr:hypothetical protein CYJ84_10245 [Lactobacillus delbrueckii]